MNKITKVHLATVFLLAGFFCWRSVPVAQALDSANAPADLVIGQQDFTHFDDNQGESAQAHTASWPNGMWTDGKKLVVADIDNNRVLIFNSIPTVNNASADVVIGQADMNGREENRGQSSPGANTLARPYTVSSDGVRLFVADLGNQRVLIYNSIPTSSGASADVVIGQTDMTQNTFHEEATADTLDYPYSVHTDGTKVYIADGHHHRVLIYNTIPTSNGASADVVVGQEDFNHGEANRGGSTPAANTLYTPSEVFTWGGKMFVADAFNNRVLIYNSIPTANNASADMVVGQIDMTSNLENLEGSLGANTLYTPYDAFTDGTRLFVSDYGNNRVLIYNSLPTGNHMSADAVIGQQNFTSNLENQGGPVAANTLNYPGALFYGAGRLFVGDVTNNRILSYSLNADQSWATKKSKNLGSGIKGKLSRTKVKFWGKKTTAKKGHVYAYENGVLKKAVKIKKNGKWKMTFSEKQRSVNKLFQFRFVNSANAVVEVSDQYNFYLTGKANKTSRAIRVISPVSMPSGGSSEKNEFNSSFWGLESN